MQRQIQPNQDNNNLTWQLRIYYVFKNHKQIVSKTHNCLDTQMCVAAQYVRTRN